MEKDFNIIGFGVLKQQNRIMRALEGGMLNIKLQNG